MAYIGSRYVFYSFCISYFTYNEKYLVDEKQFYVLCKILGNYKICLLRKKKKK